MSDNKPLLSRELQMKECIEDRDDLVGQRFDPGYFEEELFEGFFRAKKVIEITELCKNTGVEGPVLIVYGSDLRGCLVLISDKAHAMTYRLKSADDLMKSNGFCLNSSMLNINPWELANLICDNAPH